MQHEQLHPYHEDEEDIINDFERQEELKQDQLKFSEHVLAGADSAENAEDAAQFIFDAYRGETDVVEEPELTEKEEIAEVHKEVDTLVGLFDKRIKGSASPEAEQEYQHIKTKLFEDAGFTPAETKDILHTWSSYRGDGDREAFEQRSSEILKSNLQTMTAIAVRSPGSAAALHRDYGIRNFGRYSERHLLDQHEGRIKKDDVGVLLGATHDWNGALSNRGHLSGDVAQVDMNEPVIVEANSPIEAFRHMLTVKRNFGEIKQVYTAAHGSPESITFSPREKGRLTAGDLEKSRAVQRLVDNGTLTKDVEIILSACYAEKLAQTASKQTEGRVVAAGRELYGGLYTDYKGKFRQENNKPVHTYEAGQRVNGMHRIRTMGRKILQKAGIQLAA